MLQAATQEDFPTLFSKKGFLPIVKRYRNGDYPNQIPGISSGLPWERPQPPP